MGCGPVRPAVLGRFLPVAKDSNRLWIQPVDATVFYNDLAIFIYKVYFTSIYLPHKG